MIDFVIVRKKIFRLLETMSKVEGRTKVKASTIEDEVEPFLLRSELIVRTRRGRMATPKAYEHLQKEMPGDRGDLF